MKQRELAADQSPLGLQETTSRVDAPEPWAVELVIYADYYQFYVQDTTSPQDTATIWDTPGATDVGFAQGDRLIAIGTKRYAHVPVRVEMYPAGDPGFQPDGIDRVAAGTLTIDAMLGIGMPISAPLHVVEGVAPGQYGVRLLAWGFATVTDDEHGDDRYIVQLWPEEGTAGDPEFQVDQVDPTVR